MRARVGIVPEGGSGTRVAGAIGGAAAGALCAAMLLAAPAARADEPPPADFAAAAKEMTAAMTRDLGLSVIQIPEIETANDAAADSFGQAAAGLKSADKGTRREAMQRALQAFGARESDLRAILTPDQWQRFSEDRSQRAADLQTRLMRAHLGLDEAQAEQVRLVNLEAAGRMREALGPLRDAVTRDARWEATQRITGIQDEREAALKAILTRDQLKKYKETRAEMRDLLEGMRNGA